MTRRDVNRSALLVVAIVTTLPLWCMVVKYMPWAVIA